MRYEGKERGVEIEAQLRLYFFYYKTWKVNTEPCSNCASRIRLITTYSKPPGVATLSSLSSDY